MQKDTHWFTFCHKKKPANAAPYLQTLQNLCHALRDKTTREEEEYPATRQRTFPHFLSVREHDSEERLIPS
jgi:hypothetical protein